MTVPDRTWYDRPVLDVARDLLGATLTRRTAEGTVVLRLTEVEAYDGERDPGSHAYLGRTDRNATMFGEPGRLYVYRHLGLHHCVNVVCGPVGAASAVLLRAGEVVGPGVLLPPEAERPATGSRVGNPAAGAAENAHDAAPDAVPGVELARARRRAAGVLRTDRDLARGPARLTVALALDRSDDGADLTDPGGDVVLLARPSPATRVRSGPRVGVSGEGGSADRYPWRFWLPDEPTVSDYRAAAPRRPRGAAGTKSGGITTGSRAD
ncbi:DNA-3-methyladenine glycosylase [Isoptericola hypogeus]|uniref:Putative 3-methyladenine DNA glycosylase n=1 Tax=Isoptericola hypogeus TaxID=300179 RepID=A0ABN2JP21_9MICO